MMSLPGIAVIVTGASPRPGCATPKPFAQQALATDFGPVASGFTTGAALLVDGGVSVNRT